METFLVLLKSGLVDGMVLAPACVGLTLQFGVTNYVNFAFGSTLTLAAVIFWSLNASILHLDLWPAAVAGAVLTGVASLMLGAFVYAPFFRKRPQLLFMLLLTFVVSLLLDALLVAFWGGTVLILNYPNGSLNVLSLGPINTSPLELVYLAASGVILASAYLALRYTRLGKTMRAMSDDRSLAIVCGLPVERTTNMTWLFTGVAAGAAGEILALQSHGFDTSLGGSFLYLIFAGIIIGGIGKPLGAFLGALLIGCVFQLSALVTGTALSPVVAFALLVVVIMFRPQGLFGATGRSRFNAA